MASLFKRGAVYYAQWHDSERQPPKRRISLKTTQLRSANSLLRRLEQAYETGRWDPWIQPVGDALSRPRTSVTLREAVRLFVSEKRLTCTSETIKSYQSILDILSQSIGGSTGLRRVTSDQLAEAIYEPDVAASTKYQRYRVVRVFLNWCVRGRLLTASPLGGVPRPRPAEQRPRAVRFEELECICDALIEDYECKLSLGGHSALGGCREGDLIWLVPVFQFAFYTGMRISELARLRWFHVDLTRSRLLIERQKNGRESLLPLSLAATEILEALPKRECNAYVFSSPRAAGTERSTGAFVRRVSMMFTRYRKAAGIKAPASFHGLRHGFCTTMAVAGESAHVIRAAARHASLTISQRYVELADEEIRVRLDSVFNRLNDA